MTLKTATMVAQDVLTAEFTWNFDDTMVNTAGNAVDFGLTNLGGAAGKFDVLKLPYGAILLGGELITETAFDTASYTVSVGDEDDEDRYLPAFDRKGAGKSGLLTYGYRTVGKELRVSISNADVCTAGKATLRVTFLLNNRANQVL